MIGDSCYVLSIMRWVQPNGAGGMEYPYQIDWEWYASDRDGEIACFVTAGEAPIPKVVLNYSSFPIEDALEDFLKLPVICGVLEAGEFGSSDSFDEMARRGYHVFDWSDLHRPTIRELRAYECSARPHKPLTIHDLPDSLKDIVNAVAFRDIAFRDCSVLDVEQHFECSRPPPREPIELLRFASADPPQEAQRYQAGFVDSTIKWAKTIFSGLRK
jgi:hypothetical protein